MTQTLQQMSQPKAVKRTSLSIEPMGGALGAMIRGLDLENIGEDTDEILNRALHQHGVLFYQHRPDEQLSGAQFLTLAALFGEFMVYPYRTKDTLEDPRIGYIDSNLVPSRAYRTNVWHTDGTPEERPPQAALLNPVKLPMGGGDTMWASMYAAYDSLSSYYQRFLDGLEALHTTETVARRMGPGADRDIFRDGAQCTHPVVCTDPVTRRRFLYVNANYTERIVGLTDTENKSILEMLFAHINTPEFHVRWHWQLNDVGIWEERVTQHRAVADYEGHRVLRRIAIQGPRPA